MKYPSNNLTLLFFLDFFQFFLEYKHLRSKEEQIEKERQEYLQTALKQKELEKQIEAARDYENEFAELGPAYIDGDVADFAADEWVLDASTSVVERSDDSRWGTTTMCRRSR